MLKEKFYVFYKKSVTYKIIYLLQLYKKYTLFIHYIIIFTYIHTYTGSVSYTHLFVYIRIKLRTETVYVCTVSYNFCFELIKVLKFIKQVFSHHR